MSVSLSSPTSSPSQMSRATKLIPALMRNYFPSKNWKPVLRHNPLRHLKLSDTDNQHMKDAYFSQVTKGILPVEEGKKGFYHIVAALPAAGKSTVMKSLKQDDPNLIPLERDDMITLHKHANEARKKDPAKWARHLRKIEGIDHYGDNAMLDRFMKKRYNIAQGVIANINCHIDKARQNNYDSDVHLVLAPHRTIKMRAMKRFLTAAPDSGDKRLTFYNQYDDPVKGYHVKQKKHVKDVFNKYPNLPVSVVFETGDSDKKQEKTITSYEEYEKLLEHVNKRPEKKEARQKFNADIQNLRQMFLEQYPKATEVMPESYRIGALGLLREIPE